MVGRAVPDGKGVMQHMTGLDAWVPPSEILILVVWASGFWTVFGVILTRNQGYKTTVLECPGV